MLDMNIAVIGAPASGKSSFMRKALGLPDNTPPAMCQRKWTIDGSQYVVRFVELRIDDIHIKPGNIIEWPKTVQDVAVPRVDGAITMYDVTVKESLAGIPEMMSQCTPHTDMLASVSMAADHRAQACCQKHTSPSYWLPRNATNTPRIVKSILQSWNREQNLFLAKYACSRAPPHRPRRSENASRS
jgi:hypothetical protein